MSSYGAHRSKRPRMDDRGGYSKPRFPSRGGMTRGMSAYGEQQPSGMSSSSSPRILHISVDNPKYPITVDVLHTICSSSGTVERIAINKRHGVQALVEFIDHDSAKAAKDSLDGADIYSGCCTLHIEFSMKEPPLNIFKNDTETWDYTNEGLGREPAPKKTLLANPGPARYERGYDDGYGDQGYDDYSADPYDRPGGGYGDRHPRGSYEDGPRGGYDERGRGGYEDRHAGYDDRPPRGAYREEARDEYSGRGGSRGRGGPSRGRGSFRGRGGGPPQRHEDFYEEGYGDFGYEEGGQSPVLMLYGLHFEKMTCDKIFNLFCLYGNVQAVKFLKSREGVAMVQMEDPMMAQRAMQNLTNSYIYGKRMIVDVSQSTWLQEVLKPFPMKLDESPSYVNYSDSRYNRFNPKQADRNRIQPPFKTLHFFNTPMNFTQENVVKLFEDADAKPPTKIKFFSPKERATSSTGLVEWETREDAVEALIQTQHVTIPNPGGKYPFTFKMCFSPSPIIMKD